VSGFSAIGLVRCKTPENVGGALRAAMCYGASMIAIEGDRSGIQHPTDTTKSWRSIPLLKVDDLYTVIPHDCVPVAVDLIEDAVSLVDYIHPKRAFYIFGPEDGTLGQRTTSWCRDRVMVPTRHCMNLAATVNVVLYDRIAKSLRK
jgi:tRNA(Leu) C34 or U34 (ribose-2'-O)-methylase TrmL